MDGRQTTPSSPKKSAMMMLKDGVAVIRLGDNNGPRHLPPSSLSKCPFFLLTESRPPTEEKLGQGVANEVRSSIATGYFLGLPSIVVDMDGRRK